MLDPLATADDRETVILFSLDTVPYRLLLPHGRSAFHLDVAAPDEAGVGRPWVLRWSPYARGRRSGLTIASHECLFSTGPLPQPLLAAIEAAIRHVEQGPAVGRVLLH